MLCDRQDGRHRNPAEICAKVNERMVTLELARGEDRIEIEFSREVQTVLSLQIQSALYPQMAIG